MVKKFFKSRFVWFTIGLIVAGLIIPRIPVALIAKTCVAVAKFLWSQKWGILIGILLTCAACAISGLIRGKLPHIGFVRGDDENPF